MSGRQGSLEVGVDVPWVTSWTGEAMIGIGPCAAIGGRMALRQAQAPGGGRPQYSKNHMDRQRQSVASMLCPMCGRPTPPADRWTQVARRRPAGVLREKGVVLPSAIDDDAVVMDAGSIAPLHQACVRRSLRHCPHLRASDDVQVMRFPRRWTVVPLLLEVDHASQSRAGPVVSFLQLVGVTQTIDRRWRSQGQVLSTPSAA